MKNAKLKLAPVLMLEDLDEFSVEGLRNHFIEEYHAPPGLVDKFRVLIAYESVGSWGCDSSSWFLLQNKSTGLLAEVSGSHCSCYGFEDQFKPESTTIEYLKSDRFSFDVGGYDSDSARNRDAVANWIKENL